MNIVSNNEKCASLCICFAVPFSYTISHKAQNFYFIDISKKNKGYKQARSPWFLFFSLGPNLYIQLPVLIHNSEHKLLLRLLK